MPGLVDFIGGMPRKRKGVGSGTPKVKGVSSLADVLRDITSATAMGPMKAPGNEEPSVPVNSPQNQLADLLTAVQSGMANMNRIRSGNPAGPSGLDVYRDPKNPPITIPYHGGSLNFYAPAWARGLGRALREQG